jgi:hypothetical protein
MRPRPDDILITFLRDPIERLRSAFRFERSLGREMKFCDFLAAETPDLRPHLDNAIVRLLAGPFGSECRSEAEWERSTERAMANLARFDFIGLTERFDSDFPRLLSLLGIDRPTSVPTVNVTPDAARKAALADEELETERVQRLLEKRTRFDRIVYEHALSLRHQALEAAPHVPDRHRVPPEGMNRATM